MPVTVTPVVDPKLSVPCDAISVSVSALLPAKASVNVIASPLAVRKRAFEFSFTVMVVAGAVIVGGLGALTVRLTDSVPVRLSPGSVSETSRSHRRKPEVGV